MEIVVLELGSIVYDILTTSFPPLISPFLILSRPLLMPLKPCSMSMISGGTINCFANNLSNYSVNLSPTGGAT